MFKEIETRLDELLKLGGEPYENLFQAARYSALSSGKRLRPLLVLALATDLGVSLEKALDPACALEFIHTYSLIHDDLPCMDDDDFRRGKPSLHKAFNEGHAVLTGDFLLTFAFEVIAKAEGIDHDQKLKLIQTLSQRSGAHGMIGGQVLDLAYEGEKIDWSKLTLMHSNKTGALLTAALEFGGILGNVSDNDLKTLQKCGFHLGMGFQIQDDIFDATTSTEKPSSTTLLPMATASKVATQHLQASLAALQALSFEATHLNQLIKSLEKRTS